MKLLLKKDLGLLVAGETHYARTNETGQDLIDKGFADLHPEPDVTATEMKRELYKDPVDGGWKTREVPLLIVDSEVEAIDHNVSTDLTADQFAGKVPPPDKAKKDPVKETA